MAPPPMGLVKTASNQDERLAALDSFIQDLHPDHDERKSKSKTVKQKTASATTSTAPLPTLALDGPIQYRNKKEQKKTATPAATKKRPVEVFSSSESENEDEPCYEPGGEDSSKENKEFDEPKAKRKRRGGRYQVAKDGGDDKNNSARLRYSFADRKPPYHLANVENEDVEVGREIWMPMTIWNKLFDYQRAGVKWLWELHEQNCGGIMNDEMGLGKTIQMIAYLAAYHYSRIRHEQNRHRDLGPVLLVCSSTLLHQWMHEFQKWWPESYVVVLRESDSFQDKKANRLIQKIGTTAAGILITSYANILIQYDNLVAYKWYYLILDEGHKIRNPDAQITSACKSFRTPNRIILSGSPMHNNLRELWSLFDFVVPGKLGTMPKFMQYFAIPITRGGSTNASQMEVQTAYKCAGILRDTIQKYLIRRIKAEQSAALHLPTKNNQILFCPLTKDQEKIYKQYLTSKECQNIVQGSTPISLGLIHLRKICNHPDLATGSSRFEACAGENPNEFIKYGYLKRSGKMIVLETLLRIWFRQNNRCLLFTQTQQMLNILEAFLETNHYSYLKIDGTTLIASRQDLITHFNSNPSIFVFLLTTSIDDLDINLTGADRVLIFDPDWNPSTDIQERERAWSIDQMKTVTIYRLLTSGTIEEKIYHRQILEQFLTDRMLQDPEQRRFLKFNELQELFRYDDEEYGHKQPTDRTETSLHLAETDSEINLQEKYDQRSKNAEFEGQRVLHLTKVDAKTNNVNEQQQQPITQNEIDKEKHDDDFVESEAHRFAEEAVRALRQSTQKCYSAESGVPNWGAKNIPGIWRFGSQKNQNIQYAKNSVIAVLNDYGSFYLAKVHGGKSKQDHICVQWYESIRKHVGHEQITTETQFQLGLIQQVPTTSILSDLPNIDHRDKIIRLNQTEIDGIEKQLKESVNNRSARISEYFQ